jgi:hypothetical protein
MPSRRTTKPKPSEPFYKNNLFIAVLAPLIVSALLSLSTWMAFRAMVTAKLDALTENVHQIELNVMPISAQGKASIERSLKASLVFREMWTRDTGNGLLKATIQYITLRDYQNPYSITSFEASGTGISAGVSICPVSRSRLAKRSGLIL